MNGFKYLALKATIALALALGLASAPTPAFAAADTPPLEVTIVVVERPAPVFQLVPVTTPVVEPDSYGKG